MEYKKKYMIAVIAVSVCAAAVFAGLFVVSERNYDANIQRMHYDGEDEELISYVDDLESKGRCSDYCYESKAFSLRKLGRHLEAAGVYGELCRRSNVEPNCTRMAESFESAGQDKKAAQAYEALCEKENANVSFCENAAALYYKMGEKQKASSLLSRVKALGGNPNPVGMLLLRDNVNEFQSQLRELTDALKAQKQNK